MATTKTKNKGKATATKSTMTAAHKAALAKGREEGRVVRDYLDALEQTKPRRGRKRTPESIQKRLVAIDAVYSDAPALQRLQLVQEELDLEAELAVVDDVIDVAGLKKSFIKVARAYGERKGISYSAWRTVGVSASVLQSAGVARSRG
jgi:hypothetical protein